MSEIQDILNKLRQQLQQQLDKEKTKFQQQCDKEKTELLRKTDEEKKKFQKDLDEKNKFLENLMKKHNHLKEKHQTLEKDNLTQKEKHKTFTKNLKRNLTSILSEIGDEEATNDVVIINPPKRQKITDKKEDICYLDILRFRAKIENKISASQFNELRKKYNIKIDNVEINTYVDLIEYTRNSGIMFPDYYCSHYINDKNKDFLTRIALGFQVASLEEHIEHIERNKICSNITNYKNYIKSTEDFALDKCLNSTYITLHYDLEHYAKKFMKNSFTVDQQIYPTSGNEIQNFITWYKKFENGFYFNKVSKLIQEKKVEPRSAAVVSQRKSKDCFEKK